jgi:5-methylthioadenosine/S-adenosylhomocysteine deaminase
MTNVERQGVEPERPGDDSGSDLATRTPHLAPRSKLLTADYTFIDRRFVPEAAVLVDGGGRIAAAGPAKEVAALPEAAGAERVPLPGCALLPGCVNSHTHSFQVLLRGTGDNAANFRDWVDGHLYPLVERLDAEGLVAAATLAYAEMALAGTTSVGEFFYVHRGPDGVGGNAHSEAVVAAGRRLRMRVALLRTMYDRGSKPGQARFRETVDEAVENTRALRATFAGDPHVRVLPAPHSLHGASEGMVRAGSALADELGALFHIHLAEQRGDLAFAQEQYGASPLRALDQMGVVSSRTTVVHGLWLDEGERRLLGERGGALAYNPLTNMALGDGVGHTADLLARGVAVALGTDANNRLNLFDEMRAAEYLQRVTRLEMGIVPGAAAGSRGSALPLFEMGTSGGARALGLECGRIEPGLWADLVAVDLGDPSLLPGALEGGDALLNQIVYSMVAQTAVRHSWVAGEPLVVDGRLATVSLEDVRARVREWWARARRR